MLTRNSCIPSWRMFRRDTLLHGNRQSTFWKEWGTGPVSIDTRGCVSLTESHCLSGSKFIFSSSTQLKPYPTHLHRPDIPEDWDGPLVELVARLLDKDPQTRITMIELANQAWVTDSGRLPVLTTEAHPKIDRNHTESELRDCLRVGLTNKCANFKEIVEISLGHARTWRLRSGSASRGSRREFL